MRPLGGLLCTKAEVIDNPAGPGWVATCTCGWSSSVHLDPELPMLAWDNHAAGLGLPELNGIEEYRALRAVCTRPAPRPRDEVDRAFLAYHRALDGKAGYGQAPSQLRI